MKKVEISFFIQDEIKKKAPLNVPSSSKTKKEKRLSTSVNGPMLVRKSKSRETFFTPTARV